VYVLLQIGYAKYKLLINEDVPDDYFFAYNPDYAHLLDYKICHISLHYGKGDSLDIIHTNSDTRQKLLENSNY
jgi:hypothetical protein